MAAIKKRLEALEKEITELKDKNMPMILLIYDSGEEINTEKIMNDVKKEYNFQLTKRQAEKFGVQEDKMTGSVFVVSPNFVYDDFLEQIED